MSFKTVRLIDEETSVSVEADIPTSTDRQIGRVLIKRADSAFWAIDLLVRTDSDSPWVLHRRYSHADMGGFGGPGRLIDSAVPVWAQMKVDLVFFSGIVASNLSLWIAY